MNEPNEQTGSTWAQFRSKHPDWDHPYIQDIMQEVGHQNQADILNYTKDDWIKRFVATKDLSSSRSKKRFIRIFGISLAGSNPAHLFEKTIFNGNQLLDSPLAATWAAAYTLYGSGWIHQKATIDLSIPIAYTTLQNKCRNNEIVDSTQRKESKKERKKRMKGMQQNIKTTKKKKRKYKPKEYEQLGMTGENVSRKDSEFFGDRMQNKPIETTRIALQNI
jgi:esterase/lipase